MTTENATLATRTTTSRRDLVGRGLLLLASLATVGAGIRGIVYMTQVSDDRVWIESWRMTAFMLVAGLFALLAWTPRAQRGVWELLFAQKAVLVVIAVALGDVPEAREAGFVDFGLVVILVVSYLLCRGWESWRTKAAVA
ncbi:hypothetical protein ACIOD2_44665 [Amycolatopsis sp. NPDC088138]|uniref:hypothetical protein n=1 Tax=Amycolatopsis sp. NPDC088138 TaxID=3363938 RepID=UPI0037FE95CB